MSYFNPSPLKFSIIFVILGLWAAPAPAQDKTEVPYGAPILAYTYPFADPGMAQQLNAKPVVIELFSSLDCLFCPRAEALVADMMAQTKALVLVYHTDPEGSAYPLARAFAGERQAKYAAALSDGLLYTPQMILNGHVDAVGHEFDDVARGLNLAMKDTLLPLNLRAVPGERGLYRLDLPAQDLKGQNADVFMILYRPPTRVPKTMRQSATHPDPLLHVVRNITPLGGWDGRAKSVTASFAPDSNTEGFVIVVQRADGVILGAVAGP
jgi:hypothetical protein